MRLPRWVVDAPELRRVWTRSRCARVGTGVRERVKGFAQSKSVVYMQGSGTHHFPEWIDGPMFLLGYQMHAWEFGLPRVRHGRGGGPAAHRVDASRVVTRARGGRAIRRLTSFSTTGTRTAS